MVCFSFLHCTSLCVSCHKNLEKLLILCFVLWGSCFSFLSIKFYVCTWVDFLFVNIIKDNQSSFDDCFVWCLSENIILKFLQWDKLYCDLTSKSSQVFRGYLISPFSIKLLTQFNLPPSLAASACYCLNLDTETCSLCAPTHLSPRVIKSWC
jgi:hypothetical protein